MPTGARAMDGGSPGEKNVIPAFAGMTFCNWLRNKKTRAMRGFFIHDQQTY